MWLICCAVYPFCWWLALLLFAGYRLLLARWPFLFDCCWLWLVLGLAAVLALRQGGHSSVHSLSCWVVLKSRWHCSPVQWLQCLPVCLPAYGLLMPHGHRALTLNLAITQRSNKAPPTTRAAPQRTSSAGSLSSAPTTTMSSARSLSQSTTAHPTRHQRSHHQMSPNVSLHLWQLSGAV